ncbi:MAG: response regulator transcription factor [Elusimicrobia bacterium]|nr:response regulator transcription factor [Elusimicrobiota bacterium]
MSKAMILVVEDESRMAQLIQDILEDEGYSVLWARDISSAHQKIQQAMPDLVILDRKLPDADGLELLKELRSQPQTQSLPVLFVSARGKTEDRVLGMRLGGDDYLPKPFSPDELIARAEALLRRSKSQEEKEAVLQSGKLVVDLSQHKVFVRGKQIKLWPKEFELLQMFLECKKRVLRREYLFERVWGIEYPGGTRVVDVTVSNLRKRLGSYGVRIVTVKGYGYQYEDREKR